MSTPGKCVFVLLIGIGLSCCSKPVSAPVIGCSGNCQDGEGIFRDEYGQVYSGHWKNGKHHGPGRFSNEWLEEEGEWQDGHLNGQALIKWKDGVQYRGVVKRYERNGVGVRIGSEGKSLSGTWRNDHMVCISGDCQEGQATIVYIDKNHMNPTPPYGVMSGWNDYDEYRGQVRDGYPEGEGIWLRGDTELFRGHWEKGSPCNPTCSSYPRGTPTSPL